MISIDSGEVIAALGVAQALTIAYGRRRANRIELKAETAATTADAAHDRVEKLQADLDENDETKHLV